MHIRTTDALCVTMAALFGAACGRGSYGNDTTAMAASRAAVATPPAPDTTRVGVSGGEVAPNIDVSTWTDNNVIAALEGANQLEVGLGRIAERKAANPDVKDFAKMLVDDHSRLLAAAKQFARSNGIAANPAANDTTLRTMSDAERQYMSLAKGPSWDSTFIDGQVHAHQQTIADVKAMQQHTSNAQLKDAIDTALPVLEKHLQKAQQLQAALASGAANTNIVPNRPDTTASGTAARKGGR